MDDLLRKIYYDPTNPAAFGGAARLAAAANLPLKSVQKWLRGQATYTLHQTASKRYTTRHYKVSGINHLWQADLADMQSLARENSGHRYILTIIDVFSRKACAAALKSKSTKDVKAAFEHIFRRVKPHKLQSYQGTEFESTTMRNFFASHGIHQYSVKS
jgi:transposase InsO family protein